MPHDVQNYTNPPTRTPPVGIWIDFATSSSNTTQLRRPPITRGRPPPIRSWERPPIRRGRGSWNCAVAVQNPLQVLVIQYPDPRNCAGVRVRLGPREGGGLEQDHRLHVGQVYGVVLRLRGGLRGRGGRRSSRRSLFKILQQRSIPLIPTYSLSSFSEIIRFFKNYRTAGIAQHFFVSDKKDTTNDF